MENQTITIICGATATGKSSYAFNLAKQFNQANILSVDSRQFYKHLPIVSGQDKKADIPSNVALFGQGILNPDQVSNIGDFKKYADKVIKTSQIENKKLIIVGGSGLYLKAITENLANTTVLPDPVFRQEAQNLSVESLQNILRKINPKLFNSLNNSDINNPRRLIRHIEISKHPNSQSTIYNLPSTISYQWVGLKKSPENLLQSIKDRVIQRLKNGAIDEVKMLLKNYPNTSLPIYTTLGVKQILSFINKEISKAELVDLWTIADKNYAKRQNVWFKKQPSIVWYDSNI